VGPIAYSSFIDQDNLFCPRPTVDAISIDIPGYRVSLALRIGHVWVHMANIHFRQGRYGRFVLLSVSRVFEHTKQHTVLQILTRTTLFSDGRLRHLLHHRNHWDPHDDPVPPTSTLVRVSNNIQTLNLKIVPLFPVFEICTEEYARELALQVGLHGFSLKRTIRAKLRRVDSKRSAPEGIR
jgi:hypothetical protein